MDLTAMTLNAYLDEWLVLARTRVAPTTYRSYVLTVAVIDRLPAPPTPTGC